ncbi:type VII secretion integral membrane protein EccD [Goekera deserti]|uniref:Type VII secretion integral membrane protein EccD n=1 Tax=Goekera deserti TaxID=2497753 RepID=A0A7K3WCZ0_9ACTN|nr:type VII secretion integral membrane protein EccD [Goekera deserti]NDI46658.1 type VII secretion integral membrane protein EccD [Goekera deserti]NEL54227.1 type VII secretion integral membrane protein EccD [Goekera deserti]
MTVSTSGSTSASTSGATTGFCRITVATAQTRADLSVPSVVPVVAVMPTVLRFVGQPLDRSGTAGAPHGGWGLRDLDGRALDLSQSLAGNGVRDGDVLVLGPRTDPVDEPLFDDVVELVGADGVRERWSVADRRAAAGAACVAAVLLALAVLATGPRHGVVEAAATVTAGVLLLLGGGALARAAGDVAAGVLAAGLAVPAVGVGAALVPDEPWGANRVLVGLAAALVVAVVVPGVVGGGEPVAAGWGLGLLLAGMSLTVGVLLDAGAVQAAAIAAPLGLAVTTLLPVASLRLAGVQRPRLATSPTELRGLDAAVDVERTRHRVRTARALLVGSSAGALTVTVVGVGVLAADPSAWSLGLVAALLVALVLRARLYSSRAAVGVTVLAALAAVVVAAGSALLSWGAGQAGSTAGLGVLLPALLLLGLLGLVVGTSAGRTGGTPRGGRLLDLLEFLVLLALPPLVLGVWDVYRTLFHLGS